MARPFLMSISRTRSGLRSIDRSAPDAGRMRSIPSSVTTSTRQFVSGRTAVTSQCVSE